MNDICNDNKTAEEIFKKRIEQNFKLFTQEEKKYIKQNFVLLKKIYFLGFLDGYN